MLLITFQYASDVRLHGLFFGGTISTRDLLQLPRNGFFHKTMDAKDTYVLTIGMTFRLTFALMTNTLILSSLISLMSMSLEGVSNHGVQ